MRSLFDRTESRLVSGYENASGWFQEIADNTAAIAEQVGGEVPGVGTGEALSYAPLGGANQLAHSRGLPKGRTRFDFKAGEVVWLDEDETISTDLATIDSLGQPAATNDQDKLRSLVIGADTDCHLLIGNAEHSLRGGQQYVIRGLPYDRFDVRASTGAAIHGTVGTPTMPFANVSGESIPMIRRGNIWGVIDDWHNVPFIPNELEHNLKNQGIDAVTRHDRYGPRNLLFSGEKDVSIIVNNSGNAIIDCRVLVRNTRATSEFVALGGSETEVAAGDAEQIQIDRPYRGMRLQVTNRTTGVSVDGHVELIAT